MPILNPPQPDSGFDRVAGFYDAWARLVYGKSIEKAQTTFLDQIPQGSKVLVIGGGTGWILSHIFEKADPAGILYLDASPNMIEKARKYLGDKLPGKQNRVELRIGNEESILDSEEFDVILTPFLLDLFEPQRLEMLFKRLDQALLPGGMWLFTDFHHPDSAFRPIAKCLTWMMYRIFRPLTGISGRKLPFFPQYFEKYRYDEKEKRSFFGGMIRSAIYSTHL